MLLKKQIKQSSLGQIFGFIIALFCLSSTVYLAVNGYESLAKALGTTTVIGLVGIFVVGKFFQAKE